MNSPAMTPSRCAPALAMICLFLLGLFSNSAAQSSDVLDFQTLQHTGTGFSNAGNNYIEKGFIITGNGVFNLLGVWNTGSPYYIGSTALFNNSESDTILAHDDGGQFDFLGIELAPLDNYTQAGPITFRGYRDAELVATQVYQFDPALGVQHFTPSTTFRNLTEVRWYNSTPTHQFDNIVVRGMGGALPLKIGIEPPNSTTILDISHMHIGTNYTVRTSLDLVRWDYVYDFTAYSSTTQFYAQAYYGKTTQFYRLFYSP